MSESAAEGLSWTQPRDKPSWVGTGLVVEAALPRRVLETEGLACRASWLAPSGCERWRGGWGEREIGTRVSHKDTAGLI